MKKLISIIVTFALLISVMAVPVYAENNVQTIYGYLKNMSENSFGKEYTIEVDGTNEIKAYADDGIVLSLGMYAVFTVETLTDGDRTYNRITGFEIIPESEKEVGYLCGISYDLEKVYIYTDALDGLLMGNRVNVNGQKKLDSGAALSAIGNYKGAVSYEVKEDCITSITFIQEAKQSITNQKYDAEKQTFDGLNYPITENTKILYMQGEANMFTGFNPEFTYSFDVMSYDKDKNARLIIVKDICAHGMGLYKAGYGYECTITDKNGVNKLWEVSDRDVLSGIAAGSMIEFTYDGEDIIQSVTALNGEPFSEYTYDKANNKFGEYSLDNASLFDVEVIEGKTITKYEPLVLNDKLQYSGTIYTSSYGGSILWVMESKAAKGNPIVNFWARDRSSYLNAGATYEKNGYTGNGRIYLAVYAQGKLCGVYSYDLADKGSELDENNELGDIIFGRIYYGENDTSDDYTVKGFVWYDNLVPMYPQEDVQIKY